MDIQFLRPIVDRHLATLASVKLVAETLVHHVVDGEPSPYQDPRLPVLAVNDIVWIQSSCRTKVGSLLTRVLHIEGYQTLHCVNNVRPSHDYTHHSLGPKKVLVHLLQYSHFLVHYYQVISTDLAYRDFSFIDPNSSPPLPFKMVAPKSSTRGGTTGTYAQFNQRHMGTLLCIK